LDIERVSDIPSALPRPRDGHKGTFGRVLVVAGSQGMSGAAALSGMGALRGGAGLVHVAVPARIQAIVAAVNPCYMTAGLPDDANGRLHLSARDTLPNLAATADAVAIGPGLGNTPAVAAVIRTLLRTLPVPIVLDADALNVLAPLGDDLKSRSSPWVATPHPGEFARLVGTTTSEVQRDRDAAAVQFAVTHGGVLVLKGAGTVVTDGRRLFRNPTGNPGMATGGSGDVLTGLLAALLARGHHPFDAARRGVYVHGLAGDLARDDLGEESLTAADLLDYLPRAFLVSGS
jgi:NAD(P)H-hydrate epimerase